MPIRAAKLNLKELITDTHLTLAGRCIADFLPWCELPRFSALNRPLTRDTSPLITGRGVGKKTSEERRWNKNNRVKHVVAPKYQGFYYPRRNGRKVIGTALYVLGIVLRVPIVPEANLLLQVVTLSSKVATSIMLIGQRPYSIATSIEAMFEIGLQPMHLMTSSFRGGGDYASAPGCVDHGLWPKKIGDSKATGESDFWRIGLLIREWIQAAIGIGAFTWLPTDTQASPTCLVARVGFRFLRASTILSRTSSGRCRNVQRTPIDFHHVPMSRWLPFRPRSFP